MKLNRQSLLKTFVFSAAIALSASACKPAEEEAPADRAESTATTAEPAQDREPLVAPPEERAEAPLPGQGLPDDDADATSSPTPNILDNALGTASSLAPRVEELAAKLPADVVGLVVVDTERMLVTLTPGGNDQIRQALRQDLSQLFTERFGIDPMTAPWFAISIGRDSWGALIAPGELTAAQGLSTTRIGNVDAMQLKGGSAILADFEGYKVVTTSEWAPKLLSSSETQKLAQAPHYAQLQKALGQSSGDSGILAVATLDNDLMRRITADLPASVQNLDAIALTSGAELGLVAVGTNEEIQALQRDWEGMRQDLRGEIERQYQNRAQLGFQEALGVVVGRHFVDALLTGFNPTFQGELAQARIDPGMIEHGTSLFLLGGAMAWLQTGTVSTAMPTDVAEAPEDTAAPIVPQDGSTPPSTLPINPNAPGSDGNTAPPAEPVTP